MFEKKVIKETENKVKSASKGKAKVKDSFSIVKMILIPFLVTIILVAGLFLVVRKLGQRDVLLKNVVMASADIREGVYITPEEVDSYFKEVKVDGSAVSENAYESLEDLKKKEGFCNFVVSNCFAEDVRALFFNQLNKYKKVDSGGRFKNNIGGPVADKLKFQQKYKFSIAFENCSYNGYATEKIVEAFYARTIPIYYGDPEIVKDFNKDAFVNVHDYSSFNEVIQKVIEIDNNDELFLEMINQPIINPKSEIGDLCSFLCNIFDQPLSQARRRPFSMISKSYENFMKRHSFFEDKIYRYYAKAMNTIYRIKTGTLLR